MKPIPPAKPGTAAPTQKFDRDRHRRRFSKIPASGLILLAACMVLTGGFLYGQESDDALFIDESGNVTVGKKLKAQRFEGDGSALTVGGAEFVKPVNGNPPVTLEEVVRAVMTDMVPIGTIMAYGGDVNDDSIKKSLAHQGWLPCNGMSVSCDEYRELFDVIGNAYRDGHATTAADACNGQFQMPDMRGRFLRGVNYDATDKTGAPRDPECIKQNNCDKAGVVQQDAFKKHSHAYSTNTWFWNEGKTGRRYIRGDHTTDSLHHGRTGEEGNPYETRPKNIHVNWIIKAKHIIQAR